MMNNKHLGGKIKTKTKIKNELTHVPAPEVQVRFIYCHSEWTWRKEESSDPFHLLHWAHTESGVERPHVCLGCPLLGVLTKSPPWRKPEKTGNSPWRERSWRSRQVFEGLEDTRSHAAFCLLGHPPSWQHLTVKPERVICKSRGIFRKGASRCWENLWAGKLCLGPWWNLGRWEKISLQLGLGHKNAGNEDHWQLARIHSQ